MYATTMRLTGEELEMLAGSRAEAMRKALESVVRFGEAFGARELVRLEGGDGAVVVTAKAGP